MIEPQLAALMTQTAYAYPVTGVSKYGQTTYATTPITIPCHIVGRVQEITNLSGEQTVSTGYILTADVYQGLDDRCILDIPDPTQASGRSRVNIIAVATRYDEAGPHHQQIFYGARGGAGKATQS